MSSQITSFQFKRTNENMQGEEHVSANSLSLTWIGSCKQKTVFFSVMPLQLLQMHLATIIQIINMAVEAMFVLIFFINKLYDLISLILKDWP